MVLESEQENLEQKSIKRFFNDKVDKALCMWFLQKCSSGQPISGPLLCEKTQFFNEKLNGVNGFLVTFRCFRNFKLCYGIKEIRLHEENLSASMMVTTNFGK